MKIILRFQINVLLKKNNIFKLTDYKIRKINNIYYKKQ